MLKIKVDEKEYVLGTLSQGKLDQTALDLIVEKEFTVSHTGASSVYLTGYKTDAHEQDDEYPFLTVSILYDSVFKAFYFPLVVLDRLLN